MSAVTAEGTKVHPHLVEITVNNKTVEVPGPKVTGRAIKEAAIAQGVSIELDFQLAELLHGGERKIIGDNDQIVVTHKSKFIATAGDDNS